MDHHYSAHISDPPTSSYHPYDDGSSPTSRPLMPSDSSGSRPLPPLHSLQGPMQQSQGAYGPAAVTPITSRFDSVATTMLPSNSPDSYPPMAHQPLQGISTSGPSFMDNSPSFPSARAMHSGIGYPVAQAVSSAASQPHQTVALSPMPSGSFDQGESRGPPSAEEQQAQLVTQSLQAIEEGSQPLHVVGAQGRRGILPSAPGRAAALASGTATGKNTVTPVKDAEGKFPCPHCTKTYLHAKHLKRHLLRHTGDRPYTCILCKDTFSRSDILKRHFQKCSIRRGNPTGASHLSHAHGHLNRFHATGLEKMMPPIEQSDPIASIPRRHGMMDGSSGLGNMIQGSSAGYDDGSRSSPTSLGKRDNMNPGTGGAVRDPRNMAGPGPSGSSRASLDGIITGLDHSTSPLTMAQPHGSYPIAYGYHPRSSLSGDIPGSSAASIPELGNPPRHDIRFYSGQQQTPVGYLNWATLFPPDPQDSLSSLIPGPLPPDQHSFKTEVSMQDVVYPSAIPVTQENFFSGLYPSMDTFQGETSNLQSNFSGWPLSTAQYDPLQDKADRLLSFCTSNMTRESLHDEYHVTESMKRCLTVESIKHYVHLFSNFQGHWPIIHMPTFNLLEAYSGLLLAIICIGAVYSNRKNVTDVRRLMENSRNATEQTSPLYNLVKREERNSPNTASDDSHGTETEQLQAHCLFQVLFTWHGDQESRASTRHSFRQLIDITRRAGCLQPSNRNSDIFSIFHQPSLTKKDSTLANWDWNSWVLQETRLRVVYKLYLLDCAMAIYFNQPPEYDAFEVQNPLPADDAAWDARTSSDCASALGLNGPSAQQGNVSGSRLLKQPEMNLTLMTLLHPSLNISPRSTNAFGKFILIHAVDALVFRYQKHRTDPSIHSAAADWANPSKETTESLTKHDWVVPLGEGDLSPPPLPTAMNDAQPDLKVIQSALGKWKRSWDNDMNAQYPPGKSNLRRFGFCRDGVHFYWLAWVFLHKEHGIDEHMRPDERLVQVLNYLRQMRQLISNDVKGHEKIGSVGDIDAEYGVNQLSVDMAGLFAPINEQIDSPIPGVETSIGSIV